MDISSRADFSADPVTTFAMLTDEKFLAQVCEASGATDYEVSATGDSTHSSKTLPAPDTAAKFTGPTLTVVEDTVWGPAGPDGARTGQLTMTVPGQPVSMKGTVQLSAAGSGSVLQLTGDLKVAIPLLGKKLEQSAAPAVMSGFKTQQQVGETWLAQ
ncbi:hypothetical protein GCM10009841_28710 [Microlunatus panaciterrae]|uniref:DUF2505 domain-containing protein n=1 Tax=Microlunatus panaciterrae TaxID=400768 RepID=A0ABS2REV9_9ACTN|nr:DUF2505 domain-containing protein [Microlunatus panaciterrae]MBM7797531.1 hypothetical protein [Microlunatus panaciterrae]